MKRTGELSSSKKSESLANPIASVIRSALGRPGFPGYSNEISGLSKQRILSISSDVTYTDEVLHKSAAGTGSQPQAFLARQHAVDPAFLLAAGGVECREGLGQLPEA